MGTVVNPVQVTLRNILFTTDFSATSQAALPAGAALARRFGAKLWLVHVLHPEPRSPIPIEPLPPECNTDRSRAQEGMAKLVKSGVLAGVNHECLMVTGELWPALDAVMKERKIDLVVTATHGREGLRKIMLGSTAEQIFRNATCPVLTIGPHVISFLKRGRFERVLYATDFSPEAEAAFPYALALAQEDDAELILAHVVAVDTTVPANLDLPQYEDSLLASAEGKLRSLMPPESRVRSDYVVQFGFATEKIAEVAQQRKASLVVLGVRWHGVAAIHLPWRTAHRIVCHAPCPVLTVRS